MLSSTAETGTGCGVLHVAAVKVSDEESGTTSELSFDEIVNTTGFTGCRESTTVNWSVPSGSFAVRPAVSARAKPGTSSSVVVISKL